MIEDLLKSAVKSSAAHRKAYRLPLMRSRVIYLTHEMLKEFRKACPSQQTHRFLLFLLQ
jgi:hypothetical protein